MNSCHLCDMKREEALMLLAANDENWQDRVEQIVFEYKNFVFQNSIVVKVYNAKLKKLVVLNEAYKCLQKEEMISLSDHFESPFEKNETVADFLKYFRTYEQEISSAKREMSMAETIAEVIQGMKRLKNIEETYEEGLYSYAQTLVISEDEILEIKISEWINSGKIIGELMSFDENKRVSTKEILATEYLRKELKRIYKSKLVH